MQLNEKASIDRAAQMNKAHNEAHEVNDAAYVKLTEHVGNLIAENCKLRAVIACQATKIQSLSMQLEDAPIKSKGEESPAPGVKAGLTAGSRRARKIGGKK